jgi:enolase-phosphatase E1
MIKTVVTDIEGTTSSLSFVKNLLFPYARANLADYVRRHQHEPPVKSLLDDTRKLAGAELDTGEIIAQLIRWLDADAKVAPLKSLQGWIWTAGYSRGDFKGHVYRDAAENLKAWKAQGLDLYVYSSGSVQAQKLLFAHSEYGDLTPLFSGYFDTQIGGKQDPASYIKIAQQLRLPPEQILFLSDSKAELDAAQAAGFATIGLSRDGSPDLQAGHRQVDSFDLISLA